MVQQATVQKNDGRLRFLKKIFSESVADSEVNRSIRFLVEDYTAANRIAADLSSHSKWIPYSFLVDRLKKISDEMRGHAEIFRAKIIELGGQVSSATGGHTSGQTSTESQEAHELDHNGHKDHQLDVPHGENVKRLVMDMEEHSARCEALMHQRNLIDDASIAKLLNVVIVDMQRQKEELTDIIMRIS